MTSRLRYIVVVLLLVSLPAIAQQAPSSTSAGPITLKSRSELVLVPVIVRDGKGRHISGLTKDAFRIEENGRAQNVGVFEEVTTTKVDKASAAAPPPDGFSNFSVTGDRARHLTIFVLDLVNTPFLRQTEAKRQLVQYLSHSLDAGEPMTLLGITRSGIRQLHSFTTDTRVLIAALAKMRGQLSLTETGDDSSSSSDDSAALSSAESQEADDLSDFFQDSQDRMTAFYQRDAIRRTLASLDQIAQAYAGIPGRKTLVWATGGFPFMIDDPDAFGRMGLDMVDLYERTWRTLMSSNVAVYPVDVQGLLGPNIMGRPSFGGGIASRGMNPRGGMSRPMPYDRHRQQMDTMRAFADATGGTACVNNNDLANCFQRAVDDSGSYYMLGFYLGPDDRKPGWRKLKIHVATSGAHVRSREGFYVGSTPIDPEQDRKAAIATALSSPIEFTGIHMNIRWGSRMKITPPSGSKAATNADFELTLAPHSFFIDLQNGGGVDATMAAVVFDRNGKPVGEKLWNVTGKLKPETIANVNRFGLAYKNTLELPDGAREVRFAVRDNLSGELGSVTAPVETSASVRSR